jgi:hypothetical protein
MTSPDSKSDPKSTPNVQHAQAEGGGMLPALLAGAGILAVAALFIFGGDDEKDAKQVEDSAAQQANAQRTGGSKNGGVASRQTDDANATQGSRPKPRLNPRIADAVVTDGMAPVPNKKPEPTSWGTVDEEIAYWEEELRDANRMLETRKQSSDRVPDQEERIRQNGTPEDLAEFQIRKQVVADNLAKATARVQEVELKLSKLRG